LQIEIPPRKFGTGFRESLSHRRKFHILKKKRFLGRECLRQNDVNNFPTKKIIARKENKNNKNYLSRGKIKHGIRNMKYKLVKI